MTATYVRFRDSTGPRWAAVSGDTAVPLPREMQSAADIMDSGESAAAEVRRIAAEPPLSLAELTLLTPTPGARIFCQGANYRSHMTESGMDPDRAFNMLFTKSTASLAGPHDDIIRPAKVKLLDYEVELGLVLRAPITTITDITESTLARYVGGFVVANDVSARDVQLPEGQWYKGKSYRTFCPVGPYLVVPDTADLARWPQLRLRLTVNGQPRQDSLAGDMAFSPAATLSEWSHLEDLAPGDLLLTGTPGGVALRPPPAMIQKLAALLPESRRWQMFVRAQSRSGAYLQPGDLIEASICCDDGSLDLGTQRTHVR